MNETTDLSDVTVEERGGRRVAVVPLETYERMVADLDDLDDIKAYDRAKNEPAQEFVPATVADRLLAGEQPIRVWREYRGFSAAALAGHVGISGAYLSQLEHRTRQASQDVLLRLAAALKVEVGDLVIGPRFHED